MESRRRRHGLERSRGAAQGRGPCRPVARCRQAPPGSCRVLPARPRTSPGHATRHQPRPQEHRPEVASQRRNDLRRRPHHRCPLPSHLSSSLSLPSKHRRNAIRSAPNHRCQCVDVADRRNANRGQHALPMQHVQQGGREVLLRKTCRKRIRPKPDIRDIIGRWGQGCARRLRDGCLSQRAQHAGTADVSSRGSFPSASPGSSVPVRGKLQCSSSIRRSRLRHATRCSSRPVASLDAGLKAGLHGLPGLARVDKKPRTEVRGHRVIGPSRNCMARWTAFKPESPSSRRGLLWTRKHP